MNNKDVKQVISLSLLLVLTGCYTGTNTGSMKNHPMFSKNGEYRHTHAHTHYDHDAHKFNHDHTHDHPSSDHQHVHGNLTTKEYKHYQQKINIGIKLKDKNPDAKHPNSIYPQHPHTHESEHHNH